MPGILCEQCTGACCRYVALPIETPEDKDDFEDIRWYLIHENVSVFVEDDEWYISFHTPCRHLQPDSRCGIYATRPKLCRTYTTDNCDYHSGDYGWELHFTAPEHLDDYLRERFPRRTTSPGRQHARRPALKAKLSPRAPRRAPTKDRHGVPLPVFPFEA